MTLMAVMDALRDPSAKLARYLISKAGFIDFYIRRAEVERERVQGGGAFLI